MPSKDKIKLAAIMFADVVGYSRMMASNEERTLELLKDFENICSPIISKHDGEIIKKIGDELFCEFSSAKQAVDSALAIQEAIQPYNDSRPKDFKLQVRIGIHIGDIVLRDGDVFGDGVNVASRIQPFANPGGICVSNAVRDAISSHPSYNIKSEGQQELKNIIEKHTLYKVETGFEIVEDINIKVPSNIFTQSKWKVWVFGIITTMVILGFYLSNWGKSGDDINRNFLLHFKISPIVDNKNIADPKIINIIRNKMTPLLKTKFANSDVKLYFPSSNDELELLNKLPELIYADEWESFNNYQQLRDSIPEYADTYNSYIKIINDTFDYFNEKTKENIDIIISIYLSEFSKETYSNLFVFSYTYSNKGWGTIDGLDGVCKYICEGIAFNKDSLDLIYDEIVWHAKEHIDRERYGSTVGEVIEVIDSNLLSIRLQKSNSVVRGMYLKGLRIYLYTNELAAQTLDNYISDRQIMIDYYKIYPDKQEKINIPMNSFWLYPQYPPYMMKIDDFIIALQNDKDSVITNYNHKLSEIYEAADHYFFENLMEYKVEIIKVYDEEAIVKIVDKSAPYVIPRKGDWIDLLDE